MTPATDAAESKETERMTTRPTIHDEAITSQLAAYFAPNVVEWLNDAVEYDASDVEADIKSVFDDVVSFDGYKLAKCFEDQHGYDPDELLVDILSGVDGKAYRLVRDAQVAWLPLSGLVAPAIGAMVSFDRDATIGEVTANHPDGTSTVFCASLGHVRSGVGSHGRIVAWEKLTPLASPE